MKHTLHVNQFAAKELGFLGKLDLVDLCLFDSFKSFANSMRCEKMIDEGGIWFWISYALIIEEIPFSGLHTKDAIYRRMKKLEAAGIIVFHPKNQKMNKTFFQWGANYDAMERTAADVPTVKKTDVSASDLRLKKRTPTVKKTDVPTVKKTDNPLTINNPLTKPNKIINNENAKFDIELFEASKKEKVSLGAAAEPIVFVDNESEVAQLLEDYRVKEAFTMSRKIPSLKFGEYVDAFRLEINARDKTYFSRPAFRDHFFSFSAARWRGEQAAKQHKTATKSGTPNGYGGNQAAYQEKQKF